MKKFTVIISFLCLVVAATGCKKENTVAAKQARITTINYAMAGNPALDKQYSIAYNAAGKITRVDVAGTTTLNTFYFIYYYSTRLDSVVKFRTSDDMYMEKATVEWTGDKISTCWERSYTYDGSGRLSTKIYLSGAQYRVVYGADSVYFHYTPAVGAEYLEGSYTTLPAFKNPYLIPGNERESQALSFSIGSLYSDFYLASPYLMNYGRTYNADGSLYTEVHFTPEGETEGYPDKITIASVIFPDAVLEFTYETL